MSDIITVDDRPNDHPEVRKKIIEAWENTPEEEKEIVRKLLSGEITREDLINNKNQN